MGGSQAGYLGILSILSMGHHVLSAVSYFKPLTELLKMLGIPVFKSIHSRDFMKALKKSDMLISVHGREIVKEDQIKAPRLCSINVHPYLYKYKGADGIEKALAERNFKGSVGVHHITPEIDSGEVIVEEFVDVTGANTVEEIYNRLYPYYPIALLKAMDKVMKI